MAPNLKFGKVKSQTPVSVIVHGATQLGFALAKTLVEQGSKVIIIDTFTSESKRYITELKRLGDADFIDFLGLEDFYSKIGRIDYMFYMLNEIIDQSDSFTSQSFLEESNYLNKSLRAATKFNAKTTVVTTVERNRQLAYTLHNPSYQKPSPYSAVELQKYSETLSAEYHDKSHLNARIIRLGEIIAKGYEHKDEVLKNLISDSVKTNTITIHGEGLEVHYLIHPNDAVFGMLKLTFADNTNGEVITLANNNEYTTLSIAYKIMELNANATEIKFEQEEENSLILYHQYVPAPNAEKYGWKQSIQFENLLIEALDEAYERSKVKWKNKPDLEKTTKDRLELLDKKSSSNVKTEKTALGNAVDSVTKPFTATGGAITRAGQNLRLSFKPLNIAMFAIVFISTVLLFYFLLGPIIFLGVGTALSYSEGKQAYQKLEQLEFAEAQPHFVKIQGYTDNMILSLENLKWIFVMTGQGDSFDNSSQLLYGAKYGIDGAAEMTEALIPLSEYVQNFEPALTVDSSTTSTTREYRSYLQDLEKNRAQIEKASYNIKLANNLISTVSARSFPKQLQPYIVEIKQKNADAAKLVTPFEQIAKFLPELLGVDERQRYLVLLQNPSELRSTGGWISSYAIIAVEGGQLRELYVDDVYNAEGTLKVDGKTYLAPESMRKALGITNWSMSLSNWNPDFPETAAAAEFFVQETGKTFSLDGVIAMDVVVIQKLLTVWGGLSLPNEPEPITSDNLNDKIFQIHNQFTPGSSVKTTFLADLSHETFRKLLATEGKDYPKIADALLESLSEKHLLVNMDNREANRFFAANNWGGELDAEYLTAPVGIEWNWGGNKANKFLKRFVAINATIRSDSQVDYNYTLSLQNESDVNDYPEGDYVNYQRIFLPENANVVTVKGFRDNKYDIYFENGFKVVGGWFDVPILTTRTFELTYSITSGQGSTYFPVEISGSSRLLAMKVFKQPGTELDRLKIDIVYPDTWNLTNDAGMNTSLSRLNWQGDFDMDKDYSISWKLK